MKKDIFNGKVKKKYFSYILGCMIFFMLLFVVGAALCIYACVLGMTSNASGGRFLIATFGVVSFAVGGGYIFPQLFIIRNFPKYPKLRRIFFNSDIYFTDSTSNEYFGGSKTIRGRRNKAAFEIVTAVAEAEKGMGNKKPIRYIVYSALALFMGVLGLVILIAMPLLFENGAIFTNMSDGVFALFYIAGAFVCIVLTITFLSYAYRIARMAPLQHDKWRYELYTSLVDIAVRRNKKLEFWYDTDQLEQIEKIVKSASENAELKLETKGDILVSFTVIDTLNDSVIFTGLFM